MSATCQNTSLDSPLLPCFVDEAFKTWVEGKKPRNNRIKAIIYDLNAISEYVELSENYTSFVQNFSCNLLDLKNDPIQEAIEQWEDELKGSSILCAVKTEILLNSKMTVGDVMAKINQIKESNQFGNLMSLYSFRWFYENLVVATARPKKVSQARGQELNPHIKLMNPGEYNPVFSATLGELNYYASNSVFVIQSNDREHLWLTSREHLLQLLDTASQRYLTLLTSIYASLFEDESVPDPETLINCFTWGDDFLDRYGNEGYKSIKFWEPLITSFILNAQYDPHVDTTEFLHFIREDFINSQGNGEIPYLEEKYQILADWFIRRGGENLDLLSQIYGLYRIWGHPSVDGLSGVNALRKITTHLHTINQTSVSRIHRKWREYFSMNYYSKEKRWPVFTKESLQQSHFLAETINNNRPLDRHHPLYHESDWDSMRFHQTFEVPRKFEFTEMISDKATSLDIPELKARCERFGDIGRSDDRSVIIRWLRCEENDPLRFLHQIGLEGFDPDTRVCGVYPKEREGKNKPRLFGLMPLQRRLYIVLTEALIANFILKYFPEITLSFDQSTLMTRMNNVTKNLGSGNQENHVQVVTNIDFEKWNSNMRREETLDIFTDFDDLFGLENVFSRSHDTFSECQFYLADGSITPQWNGDRMINDLGVWDNHLGGIEGMRQKGWTVFTVVILKSICERSQIPFQLLGQGDNQVLILKYYPKEFIPIRTQHQNFLRTLNEFLGTIGPPIKLEESWSSSLFFTYGKFPIHRGVPLSMSLKRISRCGRLNNEGMINLDSILSSISANTSSAISLSKNPFIPLFPCLMEVYGAVKLHMDHPFYGPPLSQPEATMTLRVPALYGRQSTITERMGRFLSSIMNRHRKVFYQILCLVPSSLGGYPAPQIFDLMMHGFPDPVSASIWECKSVHSKLGTRHILLKECIVKILNPSFNPIINPELLCQDPTSLNLLRGSRPKDQIKRMVFNYLSQIKDVKNEAFMAFFEKAQQQQDVLAECLFSMEPLHPRVCASIYESTPVGVAQAITRKIQSTRTLEKMMISNHDNEVSNWQDVVEIDDRVFYRNRPRDLSDLYYRFEKNQLTSILLTLNQEFFEEDVLNDCSTQTAHKWRTESWGKELRGVSVAVPMELVSPFSEITCDNHPNQKVGYIRCQTSLTEKDYPYANKFVGPFKPFFGSSTSEKVKYEGGRLVKAAPPLLKTAMKNLRLINWGTREGSLMANLITEVFGTITDLDWRVLIPRPGNATGTLEHRWADTKTDHGVTPSVSYATSTHYTVNTNKFCPEDKIDDPPSDNVNVNHQSIFSYIAFVNTMRCILKEYPEKTVHWHVKCIDCIDYVNEEQIDLTDETLLREVVEILNDNERDNPFTWVSRNDFNMGNQRIPVYPTLNALEYQGDWELILVKSLTDWVLKENPINHDSSQDWIYAERQILVPMSIVSKIPVSNFLRQFSKILLLLTVYNRSSYWSSRIPSVKTSFMIQSEINKLSNLPLAWFKPLISLFLTSGILKMLGEELPQISPPKNCPPSERERCASMKMIVIELMFQVGNPRMLKRICESWCREPMVRSSLPIMHPEVMHLMKQSLDHVHADNPAMKKLAIIRQKQRDLGAEEWNTGMSIILESFSNPYQDPILEESLNATANSSLIDVTPDYAARKIGKRTHPNGNITNPRSRVIDIRQLQRLPPGVQQVFYRPKSVFLGEVNNILIPPMYLIPSSVNHLFKSPYFVTTAPYKLLSILAYLVNNNLLILYRLKKALCCADGVGGFSALLSQIIPFCRIIYNSKYAVENQSSVGCDNFIPAAFVNQRCDLSKVQGIHEVIEGKSDITDDTWALELSEQHKKFDLIICDAEGEGTRNISKLIRISENLCNLARRTRNHMIILKTYTSRMDLVIAQSHFFHCHYHNVHIIRSLFSGFNNTEVYIVASKLRACPAPIEIKINEGGTIDMKGMIPGQDDWIKLNSDLFRLPYGSICKDISEAYTSCLSGGVKINFLSCSWKCYFDQIECIWEPSFPTDLIKLLKDEFSLVKFNPQTRTHLRKHLLTIHVMKKLLIHYLIWVLWNQNCQQLIYFETHRYELQFVIYETIGHHWCFTISRTTEKNYGRKWKSRTLEELMDQQLIKEVYHIIREGKKYFETTGRKFPWRMCGADKYPYRVGRVSDHPDWKKRIGVTCTSVSNLPCPKRGEFITIQSGITNESHHNKELTEDMNLLKELIEKLKEGGEKSRMMKWMRANKDLNPSIVRMEKIYRYYYHKHGLFRS